MTSFNGTGDPSNKGEDQGTTFGANDQTDQTGSRGDEVVNDNIDVAKLTKRLDDSQAFIDTLKSERQADRDLINQLKEQLESRPTMESIMEQLEQRQSTNDQQVDVSDLVKQATEQVQNNLTAKQVKEQQDANFREVSSVLTQKFGNEVDAKVQELATENGLTFDEAVEMAKSKPKTLLKLFGVTGSEEQPSNKPSSSSINSAAFISNQPDQEPSKTNIMDARTDRQRVDAVKQAFKNRGLDFDYV